MNIGQEIKIARKKAGLTQEQLAQSCDLATITIRQYETNKREPRFDQIKKIAKALGVDPYSLMDFDTVSDYLSDRMSNRAKYLLEAFDQLNDEGQCKAVERVEELTEIPKYRKEKDPSEGE